MANPTDFPGDINVPGVAYLQGGIQPGLGRSSITQDNLQPFTIPLTDFVTWDAMGTPLPSVAANDDLGIVGGTFASASPSLQTQDHKAAGAVNNYGRILVRLPVEYVSGQTVVLRLHAGQLTTVADTTCTLDVQAYETDEEAGISADLCATAAQTIKSLVLADKDFTITASALVPGDILDVRVVIATNDAATGTVVKGIIGSVKLLCDVKG